MSDMLNNMAPTTITGWLTYIIAAIFFTLVWLFFAIFMMWMTLYQIFPNISIFLGVFFIFFLLFSPSIFGCCGYGKKRIKVVKTKININENNKKKIAEEIVNSESIDLINFDSKNLKKGKICIISVNNHSDNYCKILKIKFRNDPVHFCKLEGSEEIDIEKYTEYSSLNNLENNNNNNDNNNYHYNDNNDDASNNKKIIILAIFELGSKWTLFPYNKNKSQNTDSDFTDSDNLDLIEMWLSRLLGGEISWTKTVQKNIPYLKLKS